MAANSLCFVKRSQQWNQALVNLHPYAFSFESEAANLCEGFALHLANPAFTSHDRSVAGMKKIWGQELYWCIGI